MKKKFTNRLQGTDGVRAECCLSVSPLVKGLSPLNAFLQQHRITEEFMELYTYACLSYLNKKGETKKGDGFVIGWDPRDRTGLFCDAAVRGIQKAGGKAIVLKVVPTPVVPLFMQYCGAKAGFMITASHNPAGQNGIKLFLSPLGLKPLPAEDIRITKEFFSLDYEQVKKMSLVGDYQDAHEEAIKIFEEFCCAPENSWVKPDDFESLVLIIDPANGAYSGIGARIFKKLGVKEIIEINNSFKEPVNYKSGVADLEGISEITAADIEMPAGRFVDYPAILKIFEIARKKKKELRQGNTRISAAVFDADGDRFYWLDYDQLKEKINVYSGDDTAYLQAAFTVNRRKGEVNQPLLYVNTIESDLNVNIAVSNLGLQTVMTPVGDKWLLLEAIFCQLEESISLLKNEQQKKFFERLEKIRSIGIIDTTPLRKLAHEIAKIINRTDLSHNFVHQQNNRLLVGAEESGHNITPAYLKLRDQSLATVFIGNGLKSAINTLAAASGKIIPYEKGFKKTFYIYYTDKKKFSHDRLIWRGLKARISKICCRIWGEKIKLTLKKFPQEPDLFYILMQDKAIFVRNSGTEDKTGINIRGPFMEQERLIRAGREIYQYLTMELKDLSSPYARAEQIILKTLAHKKYCIRKELENEIINNSHFKDVDFDRLLKEVGEKQGLVRKTANGFCLAD